MGKVGDLAKIAVEVREAVERRRQNGLHGHAEARTIASGSGWRVEDVLCTSGPEDRSFEERHEGYSVAVVAAGTFQYRNNVGTAFMTPGALLVGNAGESFECSHEHGYGDRCIAFHYSCEYFQRLICDVAGSRFALVFRHNRVPPIRATSDVVAKVCAALSRNTPDALWWEHAALLIASRVVAVCAGNVAVQQPSTSALARVTRVLRWIEHGLDENLSVHTLANIAGLSPFHFIRSFRGLTGLTPHQYLLRLRLQRAAVSLAHSNVQVLDAALNSGFGDLSNFNRNFRREFGCAPHVWRTSASA
jgi:AraC family transcriptional regulator